MIGLMSTEKLPARSPRKALLVVDVQNDYFPGGVLPLWHAAQTLDAVLDAVERARNLGMPVILVRHVAAASSGSGLFADGTEGAQIRKELLEAAPGAPVVVKRRADAFIGTELEELLDSLMVEELIVCGMQTQNCVGLTAISGHAERVRKVILGDCCTAETRMVHLIALAGFGDRVPVISCGEAFS